MNNYLYNSAQLKSLIRYNVPRFASKKEGIINSNFLNLNPIKYSSRSGQVSKMG